MHTQNSFPPIALTIAGSDSGGGAGVQADLKAMSALGTYGASVLTALTAQNTLGVTAIHDVPVDFITAQLDAVYSDLKVGATKIGMLSQAQIIDTVADGLLHHKARNIVLDPVIVATTGDVLLADEAIATLKQRLIPIADVITPNLYEAAELLQTEVAKSRQEMEVQAKALLQLGAKAVLLKGGHFGAETVDDYFVSAEVSRWYSAKWIDTLNTHGTGCTLSAAIAAMLAMDKTMINAIAGAKAYTTQTIAAADKWTIGQGSGPVHHFFDIWDRPILL